ncbi:hypothetical protein [Flavobacterium sp.]|uniref:hypothetical protein n=1 Tax=Flavobacterium sp. TaxID=239 RepID=UPI0038FCC438
MVDENKVIAVADYQFFNVLNPAYSVCKYNEIQKGQRFRYLGEWRIKVGNIFSMSRDKAFGITYSSIGLDKFVLYFKYENLHQI